MNTTSPKDDPAIPGNLSDSRQRESLVLRVSTIGKVTLVIVLILAAAVVLYVLTLHWADHSFTSGASTTSNEEALQNQVSFLYDQMDRQLVIFGVSVGILGIAATGLIAVNVIGLLSANRAYERDRDAVIAVVKSDTRAQVAEESARAERSLQQQSSEIRAEVKDKEGKLYNALIAEIKSNSKSFNESSSSLLMLATTVRRVQMEVLQLQAETYKRRNQWGAAFAAYKSALAYAEVDGSTPWTLYLFMSHIGDGLGTLEEEVIRKSPDIRKSALDLYATIMSLNENMRAGSERFLAFAKTLSANESTDDSNDTTPKASDAIA